MLRSYSNVDHHFCTVGANEQLFADACMGYSEERTAGYAVSAPDGTCPGIDYWPASQYVSTHVCPPWSAKPMTRRKLRIRAAR